MILKDLLWSKSLSLNPFLQSSYKQWHYFDLCILIAEFKYKPASRKRDTYHGYHVHIMWSSVVHTRMWDWAKEEHTRRTAYWFHSRSGDSFSLLAKTLPPPDPTPSRPPGDSHPPTPSDRPPLLWVPGAVPRRAHTAASRDLNSFYFPPFTLPRPSVYVVPGRTPHPLCHSSAWLDERTTRYPAPPRALFLPDIVTDVQAPCTPPGVPAPGEPASSSHPLFLPRRGSRFSKMKNKDIYTCIGWYFFLIDHFALENLEWSETLRNLIYSWAGKHFCKDGNSQKITWSLTVHLVFLIAT